MINKLIYKFIKNKIKNKRKELTVKEQKLKN